MHEVVECPSRNAVEGHEEVLVGVLAGPEGAAIVAEEIVAGWGEESDGIEGGFGAAVDVDVEPGVDGAGEGLQWFGGRRL